MAFLDLVKHRKSVRNFLDTPVEEEKIMMCLEAASGLS
jgi:nitroreductase